MAALEVDIERSRRVIARLSERIVTQERLLEDLEDWASRFGLDSEQGWRSRRDFEDEIATKRETIRVLKGLLDEELERLQRLEDALRQRRAIGVAPAQPIVPS